MLADLGSDLRDASESIWYRGLIKAAKKKSLYINSKFLQRMIAKSQQAYKQANKVGGAALKAILAMSSLL